MNDIKTLRAEYLKMRAACIAKNAVIEDLEKTVQELEDKTQEYRNKLYSGKDLDSYQLWKKTAGEQLSSYLEAMAAAYTIKTDIPPDKVVLKVSVGKDEKSTYYSLCSKDEIDLPETVELSYGG